MMSYPVMRMDPLPVTPLGTVNGLPTTFIISPEGIRTARQEGPVTRAAIEQYIERKEAERARQAAHPGSAANTVVTR
jgi:hypothetical protein